MLKKTGLLAATSFSVIGSALAVDTAPQVTLSGYSAFQAYGVQNKKTKNANASDPSLSNPDLGKQDYAFSQTGEISFSVEGQTDSGLKYDYLISLSGDHGQNTSDFNPSTTENRIQLQDSWGTIQLGNADGVQDFLTVGPLNVLSATGGFGGDMYKVFTVPAEVYTGTAMVGDPKTATKVSYFTPRIAGFQMGLSFTPSSSKKGSILDASQASGVYSTHNVAAGINFAHAWNNVGLVLSVNTIQGRAKVASSTTGLTTARANRVNSWQTGALLTYDKWMFGANYTDNGTSLVPNDYVSVGADAGKAYGAAIGYNFGAASVALGYEHSWTAVQANTPKATANIYSLTADYNVAPGLGVYGEIDYAKMSTPTVAVNRANKTSGTKNKASNKGGTLITGIKIAF